MKSPRTTISGLAAIFLPWSLPLLTSLLTLRVAWAQLLAVVVWPAVVLVLGVTAGAIRASTVPDVRPAIRSAKLRYANRLLLALFMLCLYELVLGICLAAKGPLLVVATLATLLFYLPYVALIFRSQQDWLLVTNVYAAVQRRALAGSGSASQPARPRWKRRIRRLRSTVPMS